MVVASAGCPSSGEKSAADGGSAGTDVPVGGTGGNGAGSAGAAGSNPGSAGEGGAAGAAGSAAVSGSVLYGAIDVTPNAATVALCKKAAQCKVPSFGGLSESDCERLVSQPCVGNSVATLSASDAKACASAIDAIGCGDYDNQLPVCHDAWVRAQAKLAGLPGPVAAGKGCGDGIECASGLGCVSSSGDSCGTCMAFAKLGEPCATTQCASGYCDTTADLCKAYVPNGGACTSDEACANSGLCTGGHCAPLSRGHFGDACHDPRECESYKCEQGQCVGGQTALGAACVKDEECESPSARCKQQRCLIDVSCARDQLTTTGTAAIGAACNGNEDCASGYCSDTAGGLVCVLRPFDAWCQKDTECESGKCVASHCAGTDKCAN